MKEKKFTMTDSLFKLMFVFVYENIFIYVLTEIHDFTISQQKIKLKCTHISRFKAVYHYKSI